MGKITLFCSNAASNVIVVDELNKYLNAANDFLCIIALAVWR